MEKATTSVSSNAESILNYRQTIKDLQDQNRHLSGSLGSAQRLNTIAYLFSGLFFIGCGVLGYLVLRGKRDVT